MPQVGVDLVAKGNIASEANKAADAMAELAKQEHKVQAVARSLGTKDIKLVGRALQEVAKAESKATSKGLVANKKAHALETRYARDDLRGLVKERELQDKILKLVGPEMAGALATTAGVALGVSAALAVGVAAATALGVAISSAAFEAGKARDSARGLMGVLTAGQGTKALSLVDGLAEALGMKFDVARDKFIEFRQAGLDNKQSAALLKLKADLDTVDSTGKLSAEAISKVLSHKGKAGTAEEMALLAKQAGVAGDGARAAAARFTTMGGALASLDNTKTKALESIFNSIAPSINKAAGEVAKFADSFLKSERGQKLIASIGGAISKVVSIAVSSLPMVVSAIEGVIDAGEWVYSAYQKVAGVFQSNSTASAALGYALTGLKIVGAALAVGIGVVVAGAVMLAAPFYAAVAALAVLTGAIGSGLAKLWELAGAVPKIGAAIIDGLIGGIMSKVASLKATIGNIAGAVSGGFKGALGISSPSKVFAGYGKNTAEGYEQGVEKHMPTGNDFAATVAPGGSAAPVASAGAAAAGAGGGGGGGPAVWIENLNVPVGVEPEPFARAVRREVTLMLQMLQISKGAPA